MLEETVRKLAKGPNFAVISTVLPSGAIQTNVMWVDCDDEHILINTEVHRQKFKNVKRNPTATVSIWQEGNAYHFAEVRGKVVDTVTGPVARAHIDSLSRKYHGKDYNANAITSERVILKISAERQVVRGG